MIADFEDLWTWVDVVISDLYTPYTPLAAHIARTGLAPACSDAEVMTLAIVGQCCDWDEETVLFSCWQERRHLFPHHPERTHFNCRCRALAQAIKLMRQAVDAVLDLAQGS